MTFVEASPRVFVGALAAGVLGWAVVRFFIGDLTRFERIAWSFATGLLLQTILFPIVASIARAHALSTLLAFDVAVIAASVFARRSRRPEPWVQTSRLVISLLAIAGAAWLLFLVSALSEPMWSTDYLAIWGLKAKVIATTGHVPGRVFTDPALYWAHREYPLLVPLSLAMLASFAGGWHDQALALLFPLCEIATLCALFGFLSRRVSLLAGAASTALTALCFPLYRAVNAGTAEVPFAFSVVLVSTAFLDAVSERSRAILARLAVASLFCVSIKQEGTLFVLLLAMSLWVRRRWVSGWALLVPPVVHWSLLYLLRGAQTRRDFEFSLFQPQQWGDLAPRFFHVLGRILGTDALAGWLPLLAIVLYLIVTRRGLGDPLLPIMPLQILCYAVAFSVSFDPIYAVEGAFRRIAITLFPALSLVLAARLPSSTLATVNESSRS
jgi:hypothetical protein